MGVRGGEAPVDLQARIADLVPETRAVLGLAKSHDSIPAAPWRSQRQSRRIKVGSGAGIDPNFGAPEWRVLVGVECSATVGERGP
jgi:hypothetical protein